MDRITTNSEICQGQPCVRGMRFPVITVLRHVNAGRTDEQILDEFPLLELDDIKACVEYARTHPESFLELQTT
jgi:uncharacterized protein (DUF433 family)